MPKKNIPSYRLHKATGQAIVVLKGKTFYLGKWKTPASRERYTLLIAEYTRSGTRTPPQSSCTEITAGELAVRFLEHAETYYVKNGKITPTFRHCKLALRPVTRHYGREPVSRFSPLALECIRDGWVAAGHARLTINRWTGIIRQAFRWGVVRELVPANTLFALQALENLKAGRTPAPEYTKVQPVPDDIVEKTIPYCSPVIADMIRIQHLTGMRPQDVRNLRGCDVLQTGEVWRYTPYTHKTEHHGKEHDVAIGPKAQKILLPWLERKKETPEAFLFSPADNKVLRREQKAATRGKTEKKEPKSSPGPKYTRRAYWINVTRACKKAGVYPWTPNQLRHSLGDRVRGTYGLDYAQAVLGHVHAKTTEIYAGVSFEKAAEVMKEIG